MSNSLWPHGLQHTRLPCPSPAPGVCSTHAHQVGDAVKTSHPLLSPPPLAFNLSKHQGLFQWVSSLHQVAKVLGASASTSVLLMNIQDWFPLGLTGLISERQTTSAFLPWEPHEQYEKVSCSHSFKRCSQRCSASSPTGLLGRGSLVKIQEWGWERWKQPSNYRSVLTLRSASGRLVSGGVRVRGRSNSRAGLGCCASHSGQAESGLASFGASHCLPKHQLSFTAWLLTSQQTQHGYLSL